MAYTRAGLTPDGSSTYFLSRIVGLRRALELTLTNRVLTAAEAVELGIVTRVVPDAQLLDEADALATTFAAGPTQGLRRLEASPARRAGAGTLETQMELETRAIADIARGRDAQRRDRGLRREAAPRRSSAADGAAAPAALCPQHFGSIPMCSSS